MKVKELIELLKSVDPEKKVTIVVDLYDPFPGFVVYEKDNVVVITDG